MTLEEHLQQGAFSSPFQKLHLHILVVARQMDLLGRRILQPQGITPAQYNVLRILRGQGGDPIAVQSLAARMVDPSSNTSRIVDKLVDKNWADRQVCPSDRRKADVRITDSGLALLGELDAPMKALFTDTMHGLTEKEAHALNAGLSQVLHHTDGILYPEN